MVTVTGGDLFGKKLKEMADKIGKGEVELIVGFLDSANYPDGTSVPLVAFINEYGRVIKGKDGKNSFQPPRPFFRNMIAEKSPRWGIQLGKVAVAAEYDMQLTLARMGELISGQLKKSIIALETPPLAESTVKAKGFVKPLIDTSVMINSVDYQVLGDW